VGPDQSIKRGQIKLTNADVDAVRDESVGEAVKLTVRLIRTCLFCREIPQFDGSIIWYTWAA
jgi:hypothetical protein